jgi:excisionase family DNA binding protein
MDERRAPAGHPHNRRRGRGARAGSVTEAMDSITEVLRKETDGTPDRPTRNASTWTGRSLSMPITLDDIARDPEKAVVLPVEQRGPLIIQAAAVLAALGVGLAPQASCPVEDRLLSVPEAAPRLDLKESRLRELIRQGRFPAVQIGKYTKVRLSDIEAFLKAGLLKPVDERLYASYGSVHGRRRPATAEKASPADTGGSRGSSRRRHEHGGQVGAGRALDQRADGSAHPADAGLHHQGQAD